MSSESLLIDRPLDGVVRLRLNRPERANALDAGLVEDLHDAISGSTRAPPSWAPPTLPSSAAGPTSVSPMPSAWRSAIACMRSYERMSTTGTPLVAALNGPAVGGGAQLAVACDVREGGVTGAGAALAGAVDDALGLQSGVRALPMSPDRVRTLVGERDLEAVS